MQHSAPLAATYINGQIYPWVGNVRIANGDGLWIHSQKIIESPVGNGPLLLGGNASSFSEIARLGRP